MRVKTNLVIGVIFLALLSYVYFYEIKGGEERRAAAEKSKQLVDFSDLEVERLVLDRGDTVVVLEKQQGAWVLSAPVESDADQDAVERYLRNLRESQRERVIADSASVAGQSDLAVKYQLQEPRLKVAVQTETAALDTLFFGADSPTETYVYAQQKGSNPEIFTVRAWRFDNLNKGVFDLRDRRVLPFEKDEVREIRLASGGQRSVLVKLDEDSWELQVPVRAGTDQSEVDEVLNRLKNAEVEAFVDEEPDEEVLGTFGLTRPDEVEVSLIVGEDRAEKRLHIGAPRGDFYYARDLSRTPVFLVDTTLVQALQKTTSDLRDKKPLKFDSESITRIEWHRKGQIVAAEKDTAGIWSVVEPEAREARSWKLNSLLSDLEDVEVRVFVADEVEDLAAYGLDQPELRIRLLAAAEEMLDVRLGREGEETVYLTRAGVPSVYGVDSAVLADVDLKLDDVARPLKETAD